MRDWIVSETYEKIYAEIEVYKIEGVDFFAGKIINFNFPKDLVDLLREYDELVTGGVFSILGDVEEKIYFHEMKLKNSGDHIFNLHIKNATEVDFFIKYPTSKGFVNSHPWKNN